MPRLLVCRECQTIEQLPLYDGPKELEVRDPILDNVVRRHVQRHGDINPEGAALLTVEEKPCECKRCRGFRSVWDGHQDEILKGLNQRWTGFNPEFYASIDTYKEDAGRCFNLHRRPKGTDCVDWRDDSRRLTPADWKGKEVYLCDFCPVASTVVTAMRSARGMYNKQPGETE